jgi:hypothetical protein
MEHTRVRKIPSKPHPPTAKWRDGWLRTILLRLKRFLNYLFKQPPNIYILGFLSGVLITLAVVIQFSVGTDTKILRKPDTLNPPLPERIRQTKLQDFDPPILHTHAEFGESTRRHYRVITFETDDGPGTIRNFYMNSLIPQGWTFQYETADALLFSWSDATVYDSPIYELEVIVPQWGEERTVELGLGTMLGR